MSADSAGGLIVKRMGCPASFDTLNNYLTPAGGQRPLCIARVEAIESIDSRSDGERRPIIRRRRVRVAHDLHLAALQRLGWF